MRRLIINLLLALALGVALGACSSAGDSSRAASEVGIEPNPSPSPMHPGGGDGAGSDGGSGAMMGLDPVDPDSGGGCIPVCQPGWQCGPDGCGGSCGDCPAGMSCNVGIHMCVEEGSLAAEAGTESGMGIGLVPGGAQDAAWFTSQVKAGNVPGPDKLPIEGWLNQHGTDLPPPLFDRLVTLHAFVGLFYDPAEGEPTVALQLGMNSGLSPEQIEEGRFNLSVVVDRSGSMSEAGKMDFARAGLLQMLEVLDGDDTLSIVTYSTGTKVALEPIAVTEENKPEIAALIESINPGGKTNLHAGLKLGYEQVMKNIANKDLTPRVILLSDGIANEGVTDSDSILAMSGSYNDAGIGVTTIGVGQDLELDLMLGLASQGNGNFYFLDTAEKLEQVFQEEIEYLLTPVAGNLQLWFTLADGFGVEDVYGFEFEHTDGEFHLTGPSPEYAVGSDETVEPVEPVDPSEEPAVAIQTLFASKRNGLLMIKLASPGGGALSDMEGMKLSTVNYAYELLDSGEIEEWDVDVQVGSLEYDGEAGYHYFSGAIMQKNFCVLRAGLAMKQAAAIFEESGEDGIQAAITALSQARTFCTGINVQLNDADLIEDIALIGTLMDNICGESCQDPAGE